MLPIIRTYAIVFDINDAKVSTTTGAILVFVAHIATRQPYNTNIIQQYNIAHFRLEWISNDTNLPEICLWQQKKRLIEIKYRPGVM